MLTRLEAHTHSPRILLGHGLAADNPSEPNQAKLSEQPHKPVPEAVLSSQADIWIPLVAIRILGLSFKSLTIF